MKISNDVGNVGIYGGALGGVGTTTMTLADWLTHNATIIGLGLTVVSIIIGVIFKYISLRQDERQHRETLAQQAAVEAERTAKVIEEIRAERALAVPAPTHSHPS